MSLDGVLVRPNDANSNVLVQWPEKAPGFEIQLGRS